jgi:hypothetical protein
VLTCIPLLQLLGPWLDLSGTPVKHTYTSYHITCSSPASVSTPCRAQGRHQKGQAVLGGRHWHHPPVRGQRHHSSLVVAGQQRQHSLHLQEGQGGPDAVPERPSKTRATTRKQSGKDMVGIWQATVRLGYGENMARIW